MDILFKDEDFEEECNREALLRKRHGMQRAKLLRRRLDDLRAAVNLDQMRRPPGRCHELKGDRAGQISLDLDGAYRLIFEAANSPIPLKRDGGLDWTRVTSITIVEVEDTHE